MVLCMCAWFYTCIVCILTPGFTQGSMILHTVVHCLHTDAWFYASMHGFIDCSAWFTHGAWFYTREHGFIHPTYEVLHEVT